MEYGRNEYQTYKANTLGPCGLKNDPNKLKAVGTPILKIIDSQALLWKDSHP